MSPTCSPWFPVVWPHTRAHSPSWKKQNQSSTLTLLVTFSDYCVRRDGGREREREREREWESERERERLINTQRLVASIFRRYRKLICWQFACNFYVTTVILYSLHFLLPTAAPSKPKSPRNRLPFPRDRSTLNLWRYVIHTFLSLFLHTCYILIIFTSSQLLSGFMSVLLPHTVTTSHRWCLP